MRSPNIRKKPVKKRPGFRELDADSFVDVEKYLEGRLMEALDLGLKRDLTDSSIKNPRGLLEATAPIRRIYIRELGWMESKKGWTWREGVNVFESGNGTQDLCVAGESVVCFERRKMGTAR